MDRARGWLASLDASRRDGHQHAHLASRAAAIEQSHADRDLPRRVWITTLTRFFLAWFQIYLSQSRRPSVVTVGFLAAVPALCGLTGGILGSVASDRLLKAGHSLTFVRKAPIVAGMLLAMTMIACNYVNCSLAVMLLMLLVFLGKGFSALAWTVISYPSPKSLVSANDGLFNLIGNPAGITTPIIIGAIVKHTGTFHYALLYVAATALLGIVAYLPIDGEIRRLESPRDLIAGSNA